MTSIRLIGISIVFILSAIVINVNAECKLENVKRFAMEACESLTNVLRDHHTKITANKIREKYKRETRNFTIDSEDHNAIRSRHHRPTYLRVHKKNFPLDGYLVFDHMYAKLLKTHHPKYQILSRSTESSRYRKYKNISQSHENETIRRKRNENNSRQIPVSYCCGNLNRCNAEDFCPL